MNHVFSGIGYNSANGLSIDNLRLLLLVDVNKVCPYILYRERNISSKEVAGILMEMTGFPITSRMIRCRFEASPDQVVFEVRYQSAVLVALIDEQYIAIRGHRNFRITAIDAPRIEGIGGIQQGQASPIRLCWIDLDAEAGRLPRGVHGDLHLVREGAKQIGIATGQGRVQTDAATATVERPGGVEAGSTGALPEFATTDDLIATERCEEEHVEIEPRWHRVRWSYRTLGTRRVLVDPSPSSRRRK